MKSLALVLVGFSALTSVAHADGFRCETTNGDLNIKVFNHTAASEGTRNAAIMVLSDPSVGGGRKTIATFTDVKNTLSQSGASYDANVDLRVSGSSRQGEYVGGSRLGYMDHILVQIDYSFAQPVADGDEMDGTVTFEKRDGTSSSQDLKCVRYLRN